MASIVASRHEKLNSGLKINNLCLREIRNTAHKLHQTLPKEKEKQSIKQLLGNQQITCHIEGNYSALLSTVTNIMISKQAPSWLQPFRFFWCTDILRQSVCEGRWAKHQ